MAKTANTKASAANIAALIDKARKLTKQADVMIKQAQDECNHPNVTREPSWDHVVAYIHTCPDCGKRWVE